MTRSVKSAVLVIDVQAALFDAQPRPFEADEVIKRISQATPDGRTDTSSPQPHPGLGTDNPDTQHGGCPFPP